MPVDESIQRAIDAHSVDPLPGKLTNTTNNTIANEHEKGTLETIQDLKVGTTTMLHEYAGIFFRESLLHADEVNSSETSRPPRKS